VFWVISVYFNIRNTLPKSGTFLLGHPVYIYIYIYIYVCVCVCVCVFFLSEPTCRYENSVLLGSDAAFLGSKLPTVRRNILALSSRVLRYDP